MSRVLIPLIFVSLFYSGLQALAEHGGKLSVPSSDIYASPSEEMHPDPLPAPSKKDRPLAPIEPSVEVTQKFIRATSTGGKSTKGVSPNALPLPVQPTLPKSLTFFLFTQENEKLGLATIEDYRSKYLTMTIPVTPFKQTVFEQAMDKAYAAYVKNWQNLPDTIDVVVVSPNQEATGDIKTDEEVWPVRDLTPWAQKVATRFKRSPEEIVWDLLVPVPKGLRCSLPRAERVGLNKKSEITDPAAWSEWLAKFPVFIGGSADRSIRNVAASTYLTDTAYFCAMDRDMPYLLKK